MVASHDPTPAPTPSLAQFSELVRRHQAVVCAAAYGVTGDRALSEDIAQETFLAAWQSLATLQDRSKLRAWLRGIARNLAHKARRRRRPVEALDGGQVAADDDPRGDAIARDDARVVWTALAALPGPYREALALYYWEEQSARQVGAAMGISEATAMQRLSRGRVLLRAEVERRIEGVLRGARPGTGLTVAIVAAIAAGGIRVAAAAGTGSAVGAASAVGAGHAGGASPAAATAGIAGVSRRAVWKTGLALGALQLVGAIEAWIVEKGRRGDPDGANDAEGLDAADASDGRGQPAATKRVTREARPISPGAGREADDAEPQTRREAERKAAGQNDERAKSNGEIGGQVEDRIDDARDDDGEPMMPVVTSDDGPVGWADELVAPLSTCFADELVDRPCRIDASVRGGAIAAVRVHPFDGDARRVVVRTLQVLPSQPPARALAVDELAVWIAADRLIQAVRDEPDLPDRDRAMSIAELVATCAQARLVGRAVAGPDGTRTAWFRWTAEPPRALDAEAYAALGVARGLGRGPDGAPVTVVAFVDIAGGWGFGGKAIASWGEVLERWPDEVRVVVKVCPMVDDHAMAAEAVHAAAAQGALWPMLARIGGDPSRVAREDLIGHAAALGLDAARFAAELAGRAFRDAALRDVDQMVAMDIDALPCALVNGRRVHGALPAASCLAAVEQALARARAGGNARASAGAGSGDR